MTNKYHAHIYWSCKTSKCRVEISRTSGALTIVLALVNVYLFGFLFMVKLDNVWHSLLH